ncbi:AbiH family protein [Acinetobacter sp. ANC 3882]|uniref:AbiH family protein n=1 Tax=Acinetobacter sp. ANC 3882 TaxID=2923423 RepID=UPI001F4A9386|nr:AbiH family protein [Acinetobacter sp. ANC 3882]MCH7314087.1 bacteriophage abortive infection AbiH family protein [Acinetobacter sp. ANC 3882]
MNILIVGNGFDLSHYLPTKYDHFMDVMKAIESKETGEKVVDLSIHTVSEWIRMLDQIFEKRQGLEQPNYDMDFNELFSCIRDKWFIEKTKELYLTEQIKISCQDVLKLQYRLKLNDWYQYFKNHVEEIKTWIDFEQKIEEVLTTLANCIVEIEKVTKMDELFEYFSHKKEDGSQIKVKDLNILNFFNFISPENYSSLISVPNGLFSYTSVKSSRNNLNPKFCHGQKIKNGFNPSSFLDYLYQKLDEFIEIFNLYLELIINNFQHKNELSIDSKDWIYPDFIYSFNYTNTYSRLYDCVKIEYLHGSHGEYQNIVLGISDLEHENLKKLKAYGFTKYHQKLLKDTDYLFLDEFKNKISLHKNKIEYFEKDFGYSSSVKRKFERQQLMEIDSKLDLNIYIWGHSLDISDKDYIVDLFGLNDDLDRNVRIIVYYFDKNAKFSLLNNLLAILGKDKVELWMKNGWLKFEPNPNVVEINNIQPVDLPKFG